MVLYVGPIASALLSFVILGEPPALIHFFGGLGRVLAKILVVDDDPAVQTIVRLLLERAGHSVVAAPAEWLLSTVDACLAGAQNRGTASGG